MKRLAVLVVLFVLAGSGACRPPLVTAFHPSIKQGGRTEAIAVDPGDANRIIVASDTGGLFSTKDGGDHWKHIDYTPHLHVSDVAFAPSNRQVVIASYQQDFITNSGCISRSETGGADWAEAVGACPLASERCTNRPNAYGLSFAPDTSKLYVATDCGIAISTDLGLTWTRVVLDPTQPTTPARRQDRVWSVHAAPLGRVYAAADQGIWISTDAGGTWTRSPTAEPAGVDHIIHALTTAPTSSLDVLLAATETNALYRSTDGGQHFAKILDGTRNRRAFVRAAALMNTNTFYYGDGTRLRRTSYLGSDGIAPTLTWSDVIVDHPDPADIGFANGTPVLLGTDGGVHKTATFGQKWTLTGGGKGGYNALQITEATGTVVSGVADHTDLYFGTQDNFIWASSDGGSTWTHEGNEGYYIRVAPAATADAKVTVTGANCSGPAGAVQCKGFKAGAHLSGYGDWPDAPDNDADINDDFKGGIPFPLSQSGHYLQRTRNDDVTPDAYRMSLTLDTGANWADRGALPAALMRGPLSVRGSVFNPTVFEAIDIPGTTTDGSSRLAIAKITNVYGPGDLVVTTLTSADFDSLGTFKTDFAHYRVFAVDPMNVDHIIAPDLGSGDVKVTYDGGTTWQVDTALTNAVTSNGAFQMSREWDDFAVVLVNFIQFHPSLSCVILVGTAQNGLFVTLDTGLTWQQLPGSTKIMNAASAFFISKKTAVVASYGRGLWKVSLPHVPACPAFAPPPAHQPTFPGAEFWQLDGKIQSWLGGNGPQMCPTCTVLGVASGTITELLLDGDRVRSIGVSSGYAQNTDRELRPVPIGIPLGTRAYGRLYSNNPILRKAAASKAPVRALVLDGDRLHGMVLAPRELRPARGALPALAQPDADVFDGPPTIDVGKPVRITGSGFAPTAGDQGRLSVWFEEDVIARNVEADKDGTMRIAIDKPPLPGEYTVYVEQRVPDGIRIARHSFRVARPAERD